MYKSCSRCGKIHDYNHNCYINKSKIKNDVDKLRSTYKWQLKVEEIKDASNYLCAVCRDNNVYTYNTLEIHHIEKLQQRPELFLDDNNLICLCKKHHKDADNGKINKEYLLNLVRLRQNER